MRYVYMLIVILCAAPLAMADESDPSPIVWSDILLMLIKQVLPVVGAFFSGYLTKVTLWLMDAAGAKWAPLLTTVIGMVTSGVSAALLGQSPDMISATATVGAGAGAAGHAVMQSKPLATDQKQESAT